MSSSTPRAFFRRVRTVGTTALLALAAYAAGFLTPQSATAGMWGGTNDLDHVLYSTLMWDYSDPFGFTTLSNVVQLANHSSTNHGPRIKALELGLFNAQSSNAATSNRMVEVTTAISNRMEAAVQAAASVASDANVATSNRVVELTTAVSNRMVELTTAVSNRMETAASVASNLAAQAQSLSESNAASVASMLATGKVDLVWDSVLTNVFWRLSSGTTLSAYLVTNLYVFTEPPAWTLVTDSEFGYRYLSTTNNLADYTTSFPFTNGPFAGYFTEFEGTYIAFIDYNSSFSGWEDTEYLSHPPYPPASAILASQEPVGFYGTAVLTRVSMLTGLTNVLLRSFDLTSFGPGGSGDSVASFSPTNVTRVYSPDGTATSWIDGTGGVWRVSYTTNTYLAVTFTEDFGGPNGGNRPPLDTMEFPFTYYQDGIEDAEHTWRGRWTADYPWDGQYVIEFNGGEGLWYVAAAEGSVPAVLVPYSGTGTATVDYVSDVYATTSLVDGLVYGSAYTPGLSTYEKSTVTNALYKDLYGTEGIAPSPQEWFSFDVDTGTITGYVGPETAPYLAIPPVISNRVVEIVGDGAFYNIPYNYGDLGTLYVPNTIHTFGTSCFAQFRGDIYEFPQGLKGPVYAYMYDEAGGFSGVKHIGDGVTSIGNYAFALCTYVTELHVGKNVRYVGNEAFAYFGYHAPCAIYWYGDAPTVEPDIFADAVSVTNYVVNASSAGWGDTLAGFPVIRNTNVISVSEFDIDDTLNLFGHNVTWNSEKHTFNFELDNGVVNQYGQEDLLWVHNHTFATIPNGGVVCSAGAVGDNAAIRLAMEDDVSCAWGILGMVTEDDGIGHGENGYICPGGEVNNLPLPPSVYSASNTLWLHKGWYTNVEPVGVAVKYKLGTVLRAHATEGRILFRPVYVPNAGDVGAVDAATVTNIVTGMGSGGGISAATVTNIINDQWIDYPLNALRTAHNTTTLATISLFGINGYGVAGGGASNSNVTTCACGVAGICPPDNVRTNVVWSMLFAARSSDDGQKIWSRIDGMTHTGTTSFVQNSLLNVANGEAALTWTQSVFRVTAWKHTSLADQALDTAGDRAIICVRYKWIP